MLQPSYQFQHDFSAHVDDWHEICNIPINYNTDLYYTDHVLYYTQRIWEIVPPYFFSDRQLAISSDTDVDTGCTKWHCDNVEKSCGPTNPQDLQSGGSGCEPVVESRNLVQRRNALAMERAAVLTFQVPVGTAPRRVLGGGLLQRAFHESTVVRRAVDLDNN